MTITATREVTDVNITVTRNGNSIILQPVISRSGQIGNIDGGNASTIF